MADFSLRALFEQFIPDGRELVDSWNPRHGGEGHSLQRLEESGAVTTGTFSRITGQVVYNAILDAFRAESFVFSPLVRTIPTQFNGEKIAGISRLGDEAETVPEGRPYPHAGVAEDFLETPATTKRGMIVGLTREAVFFDGPAGSQVPTTVAAAMTHYLLHENANHGGTFATSVATDAMVLAARTAATDLFGADDPEEVVFGEIACRPGHRPKPPELLSEMLDGDSRDHLSDLAEQ